MKKVTVEAYAEKCLLCGRVFRAPTTKRLTYLLEAHKKESHGPDSKRPSA